MKEKTAQFISFVFHPLVFAILIPFIITYHATTNISMGLRWTIFSIVFIFSSLGVFFLIKPNEYLSDFDISQQERRPLFYTIMLFFSIVYFGIAVFFKGIFFPLSIVALGIILSLIIFDFANKFMKVSTHASVSTAFVVTYGILYGPLAFAIICWIPFVVSWSRLFLRKHTIQEVVSGAVIGCCITLLTFVMAKIIL